MAHLQPDGNHANIDLDQPPVVRGLRWLRQPERFAPWLFTVARRTVVTVCGGRAGRRRRLWGKP
ncbi:hypothetical protein ACFUTR_05435 [Streptomyces sp. NPDC057367]|uniref:hypothetical protein n=1 Tax=Streptomyces sp. NPDC057367 TaxID=3346108 RepID=UPI0036425C39